MTFTCSLCMFADACSLAQLELLKNAFNTDVSSITAMARLENSNAINPIQVYRSLNYKQTKSKIRVTNKGSSSGIV